MNRIKQILRDVQYRPLTYREDARAVRLYNVYCFGYALGMDAQEMIFLPGEGGPPIHTHIRRRR